MRKSLMRIPYTDPLPSPTIIPLSAVTLDGAIEALHRFFAGPLPKHLPPSTAVLSGAGLSVASGLADYRGTKGTYRVNKTYRPIYYNEFITSHEARKRYWARSFLGWSSLRNASPNRGHFAIRDLGQLGLVNHVITQNVDSFHPRAHSQLSTVELHGYLRATICVTCKTEYPREEFQGHLARLNPKWADLLKEALASGALNTEDPVERRFKGLRANPDGDVDLPDAPYTTFRYPPCPKCHADPPTSSEGTKHVVEVDADGAWASTSTAGVLKPAVVMFGESIDSLVKTHAEEAIDQAGRLLVVGTSLATYSAWRLAKRAHDRGMPLAVINLGGVRGEEKFFANLEPTQSGERGVRADLSIQELLPSVVSQLARDPSMNSHAGRLGEQDPAVFKDMLS